MPIYVSDNAFGDGDYVEFYGERNTLGLDTTLYQNWQKDLFNTNTILSMTQMHIFDIKSKHQNNLRYAQVNPDFNANVTVVPYYMHDELNVFKFFITRENNNRGNRFHMNILVKVLEYFTKKIYYFYSSTKYIPMDQMPTFL